MASPFARLLAPLVAGAVATLVAACCCQTYSSCGRAPCVPSADKKAGNIPSTYSTVFQRLVVTNKHTKPIYVTSTAWDDSGASPVQVPLTNTPSSIPTGGSQAFLVPMVGTNVNRLVVTYLAADDSNQLPAVEVVTVGSGVVMITRCVRSYQPETDFYLINDTCESACPPPCQPACPPPCQPACR